MMENFQKLMHSLRGGVTPPLAGRGKGKSLVSPKLLER
jgi:hypothetical protein